MSWITTSAGHLLLTLPIIEISLLKHPKEFVLEIIGTDEGSVWHEELKLDEEKAKEYALQKAIELLRQQATTIETHLLHKKVCPRCTHQPGYTGPHVNCVLR